MAPRSPFVTAESLLFEEKIGRTVLIYEMDEQSRIGSTLSKNSKAQTLAGCGCWVGSAEESKDSGSTAKRKWNLAFGLLPEHEQTDEFLRVC